MNKVLRVLVWVVAVAAVLIIVTIGAVALFFPKEKAKDLALQRLSTALNREVKIDGVDISFWGGLGVYLKGIKISNPRGFTWDQFMEAEALDIKLRFWPLLKGEIAVDRTIIVSPRIGLFKTRTGQVNYLFGVIDSLTPEPMKDKMTDEGKVAATAISFENLSIKNGHIDYVNDSSKSALTIFGLNLNSRLTNPSENIFNFNGNAAMDSLKFRTEETTFPTLHIEAGYSASADLNKSQASINNTTLTVNGIAMKVQAGIPNIETFDFANLEITAENSRIDELLALVPESYKDQIKDYKIDGRLNLKALVKYNAKQESEPFTYSGNLEIRDLNLTSKRSPGSAEIAAITADFTSIDFNASISNGRVNLKLLEPMIDSTGQTNLDGNLTMNLKASGKIDNLYGAKISGDVELPDGKYSSPSMAEPLQKIDLKATLTPGSLNLQKMDIAFASSDASLTGQLRDPFPGLIPGYDKSFTRPFLTFELTSSKFDYDSMFPDSLEEAAAATGTDSIPIAIPLPDIDASGTGKFNSLIYNGVDFTNVTTNISVKDRVIKFDDVDGNVYTGKIQGNAAIDLSDSTDPKYSGTYKADKIQLDDFLEKFAGFGGHIFGEFNMDGTFGASGWDPEPILNSLSMNGDALLKNGKMVNMGVLEKIAEQLDVKMLDEEAIRDLTTKFHVEDGKVNLDDFTFTSRYGNWTLGGYIGFDGALNYKGSVLLTEEMSSVVLKKLNALQYFQEGGKTKRLDVPFTLKGTYKTPDPKLDYQEAIKRNLPTKGAVKDLLNNLLGN